MKNIVILSLKSEEEGTVTGTLCILCDTRLSTTRPEELNDVLRARGIKKFAFMGARAGVECSFPLTIGDLYSISSLVENADQVLFVAGLEGNFSASSEVH